MTDFKTIEALRLLLNVGVEFEDAARLLEQPHKQPQAHPWEPISHATVEMLSSIPESVGHRIVVLQRGWVVVGDVTIDGQELEISNARVIRRWGTTKGLGELVDGPLADTVLDDAGTVRAHVLGVVLTIDVDASKWAR